MLNKDLEQTDLTGVSATTGVAKDLKIIPTLPKKLWEARSGEDSVVAPIALENGERVVAKLPHRRETRRATFEFQQKIADLLGPPSAFVEVAHDKGGFIGTISKEVLTFDSILAKEVEASTTDEQFCSYLSQCFQRKIELQFYALHQGLIIDLDLGNCGIAHITDGTLNELSAYLIDFGGVKQLMNPGESFMPSDLIGKTDLFSTDQYELTLSIYKGGSFNNKGLMNFPPKFIYNFIKEKDLTSVQLLKVSEALKETVRNDISALYQKYEEQFANNIPLDEIPNACRTINDLVLQSEDLEKISEFYTKYIDKPVRVNLALF